MIGRPAPAAGSPRPWPLEIGVVNTPPPASAEGRQHFLSQKPELAHVEGVADADHPLRDTDLDVTPELFGNLSR